LPVSSRKTSRPRANSQSAPIRRDSDWIASATRSVASCVAFGSKFFDQLTSAAGW
jgi:hypothetical protein